MSPGFWVFCACVVGFGVAKLHVAQHAIVTVPLALPTHSILDVVRENCVGQPDGTWHCVVKYTEQKESNLEIWRAWPECDDDCID